MYDTVNFILFNHDYPHVNFTKDLPKYLTTILVEGKSNQGSFINGYLDTYKISINGYRVKIQGSGMGRYLNGNNQDGMSLQQARLAVEKLSDVLHLNMDNAKVTRIDIGKNIITKYKPNIYFPYLGESTGYKRLEAGEGLYYKNSLRELVFYDKIREQKNKRKEIQDPFPGHNLLRYELRFKSRLERELKQEIVTGRLLYDEAFYIGIAKYWRDQYIKITKRSNMAVSIQPTTSTRNLMASLAAISIQEVGDENVMRMILEWQEKGLLTKKQASDHRKFIRDAVKKDMLSSGNEFVEELDKKIKQSVRFFV